MRKISGMSLYLSLSFEDISLGHLFLFPSCLWDRRIEMTTKVEKQTKFTDQLVEEILPIWRANHSHPFVQGIGHGTLAEEKFRHYLVQDYLYLKQYTKVFAVGIQKANDLEIMTTLAESVHGLLSVEMSLHRKYAERFGLTEDEFTNAKEAPTTIAYTRYMLSEAQNGTLAHVIAAVLPCAWSYLEIGKELSQIPGAVDHPLYGDWVKMYSSEEFYKSAQDIIDLMDQLASNLAGDELEQLKEIFLQTTRFEYLFWEMGNELKDWPEEIKAK